MTPLLWSIAVGICGIFAFTLLSNAKVGKRKKIENVTNLVDRPLGLMERYYAAYNPSRLFCISLNIKDSPPPSLAQVKEIFIALGVKHPILALGLDYSKCEDPPSFTTVDKSHKDFTFPIRFEPRKDDGTFQQVIKKEINTPFGNYTSPTELLWRVTVVGNPGENRGFDLVFVFHHIAVDGMSAVMVAKEFTELYTQLARDGKCTTTPPKTAPLPIEALMDIRPSFKMMFATLLDLLSPPALKKPRKDYLGPAHAPQLAPFKTEVGFLWLHEEQVSELASRCKKQGTTIHGALCAASFFACAQASLSLQLLPCVPPGGIELSCTSPVSLRSDLASKGIDKVIGPYMAGSRYQDNFAPQTRFWDVAKKVRESIIKNKDTDIQMNGMLSFVGGSWRDFVNKERVKNVPNSRLNSIEVSNLGRVEFASGENCWNVDKVWFTQGNHYSGPVFCNSVATTNGHLTCSLSIPSPLISSSVLDIFTETFLECISKCGNPDLCLADISD